MQSRLLVLVAFAASLAMGGAALAEPPKAPPASPPPPPQLKFLTAADIDPSQLLPPPPVDYDDRSKAELAELEQIAATRTDAQFAAAMADEKDETPTAFAAVMGQSFDLKALPATAKMLADVRNDQKIASDRAKNYFQRNRPWILNGYLKTCSREDPPLSSYPSGHSSFGFSVAVALGTAAPDKAQALLTRAEGYAENRMVCSMHYRSDIVAGQALGTLVAAELLHVPAFRKEVEASHAELVAAHLTAGP